MKALFKNKESALKVLEIVHSTFGGCGQTNDDGEKWAVTDCNGFETVEMGDHYDSDQYGTSKSGLTYLTVTSNVVCAKACELEDFIAGYTNFFDK